MKKEKVQNASKKRQLSAGWPIDLSADIPIFPPFFTVLFSFVIPSLIPYFVIGFDKVAIWDENDIF